jgi:hypothetical protein
MVSFVAKGKPRQRAFRTLPKLQSIRLLRDAGKLQESGLIGSYKVLRIAVHLRWHPPCYLDLWIDSNRNVSSLRVRQIKITQATSLQTKKGPPVPKPKG